MCAVAQEEPDPTQAMPTAKELDFSRMLGDLLRAGKLEPYMDTLIKRLGLPRVVQSCASAFFNKICSQHSQLPEMAKTSVPAAHTNGVNGFEEIRQEQIRQARLREQQQHEERAKEEDVISEEDEEEMDQANLYAQYRPAKVREGFDHPDAIVESQSLAGVTPPDVTYKHHLKAEVRAQKLSNAQLETVLYSMMRFNHELPSGERAGFFLGDGAGVGKGRQIAAIIKEYWATGGRRVLWVSTSRDLAYDARRDLDDMGCDDIAVHPKNKDSPPAGDLDKHYKDGVLFITYSLLTVKGRQGKGGKGKKAQESNSEEMEPGMVNPSWPEFGGYPQQESRAEKTYKQMLKQSAAREKKTGSLSAKGSRLSQIKEWLQGPKGDGKDALIIFDECHRAKNLLDSNGGCTMTGIAVDLLQSLLPKARVLYSRSGLGGVEMFAMGLKAMGAYLCRTLSYRDAEFRLETINIDPAFKILYDRSTQYWSLLLSVLNCLPRPQGRDSRKGLFWAAHQRFYKGLLIAAKVNPCVKLCQQALKDGMCVVIGMQSTGEANMAAAREIEGDEGHDDLVSAPKMVLHNFVKKHLFKNFTEMHPAEMDCLLAQVYNAVREWRRLKPAADEAVVQLKSQARRKAREDKARKAQEEKRRRQEEAEEAEEACREAAKASGSKGGTKASSSSAAAPARTNGAKKSTSGAACAMEEDSEEDEGIQVMEERNLDQVLQARQATARLTGNFFDLTKIDEEKVAADVAALDAEEFAETEAVEEAKAKAKEKEYLEALDAAKKALADLQAEAAAAQQAQDAAQANQAKGRRSEELDDEMVDQGDDKSNPSSRKRGRRKLALNDSDDSDDEAPSKHSRGSDGQPIDTHSMPTAAEPSAARKGGKGTTRICDSRPHEAQSSESSSDEEPPLSSRPQAKDVITISSDSDDDPPPLCSPHWVNKKKGHQPPPKLRKLQQKQQPQAAAANKRPDRPRKSSMEADEGQQQKEGVKEEEEEEQQQVVKKGRGRPKKDVGGVSEGRAASTKLTEQQVRKQRLEELQAQRQQQQKQQQQQQQQKQQQQQQQKKQQQQRKEQQHKRQLRDESESEGSECKAEGGNGSSADLTGSNNSSEAEGMSSEEEVMPTRTTRRGQIVAQRQSGSGRLTPLSKGSVLSLVGSRRLQIAQDQVKDAENILSAFRASVEAGPSYRMSVKNNPLPRPTKKAGKQQQQQQKKGKRTSGSDEEEDEDLDNLVDETEDGNLSDLANSDAGEQWDEHARGLPDQIRRTRKLLLRLLDALELPPNPLDQLTEMLGGESKVAEMTGRKGMMVRGVDGKVSYKTRREEDAAKMVNLREKEDFMSGRKLVAVISEAASTGISLQADRRVANQRRRFHITLELPWSADRAIQQFGRSHRSNQSSAPIYCLMVSNCGGEYRFAGAVAKRLASLGALLQGDQRAMGAAANLKSYDIDTHEAGDALKRVYEDVCNPIGIPMPGVEVGNLPDDYFTSAEIAAAGGLVENIDPDRRRAEYYKAMRNAMASVGLVNLRFLNRMLGLPLEEQQLLFEYFAANLQAHIRKAKSEGKFQEGMTVLRNIPVYVDKKVELHRELETDASTHYVKLRVDDGLTWAAAKERRDAVRDEQISKGASPTQLKQNGFYISHVEWGAWKRHQVILCTEAANDGRSNLVRYRVQRPNQNQSTIWTQHQLLQKYRPLTDDEQACKLWKGWYGILEDGCLHGPNCKAKAQGGHCFHGSRSYYKHIVSGALLPVLSTLFKVHETSRYGRNKEGFKMAPHALRCTVILPQEEQQQQQLQLQQQGPVDLTAEDSSEEQEEDGSAAATPSRRGAQVASSSRSPGSARKAQGQPQTRLMVGFEMLQPDVEMLAAELMVELD
ncbi:hypothetical protein DUNSADRAFT_15693 [Dunaliella salina]|uniref:Uncharacterized protein n=1 Tax=Dunaliella salina TaxID=3046 RepID=A0ABQ7G4X4_DUNSA|nr:hypothetical protein DUNSADRAFT_15693 [Dunaliella salina]|eukprot:KAF5829652.1 hypothetical protein DUNSADRAFT_15693 [Dunaliella salina]